MVGCFIFKLYLWVLIFIYLAVPGLSHGLWYLVPWLGIESRPPCIGNPESQPPGKSLDLWVLKTLFDIEISVGYWCVINHMRPQRHIIISMYCSCSGVLRQFCQHLWASLSWCRKAFTGITGLTSCGPPPLTFKHAAPGTFSWQWLRSKKRGNIQDLLTSKIETGTSTP